MPENSRNSLFTWIVLFIGLRRVNRAFLLHGLRTDPSGVCLPSGVPADLQSAVKKYSTYETGGFAIPPQSINS